MFTIQRVGSVGRDRLGCYQGSANVSHVVLIRWQFCAAPLPDTGFGGAKRVGQLTFVLAVGIFVSLCSSALVLWRC